MIQNTRCLNEDRAFFVIGHVHHWTSKNRIKRVEEGAFYGSMSGYSSVTNPVDDTTEQPMVWITNAKDRSHAELIWGPHRTDIERSLHGTIHQLSER